MTGPQSSCTSHGGELPYAGHGMTDGQGGLSDLPRPWQAASQAFSLAVALVIFRRPRIALSLLCKHGISAGPHPDKRMIYDRASQPMSDLFFQLVNSFSAAFALNKAALGRRLSDRTGDLFPSPVRPQANERGPSCHFGLD